MYREKLNWRDTGLHTWGCMSVAFTMPVAKKFVPGFIVLLGIYGISHCISKKKISLPSHPALLLLALIFMLHVAGLLWSSHVAEGWNEIGIKSSYIVFPILSMMIPLFSFTDMKKIFTAFILGCMAAIFVCVAKSFYNYSTTGDMAWFSYESLGGQVMQHPTYLAAYLAFALFMLLRYESKKESLFGRSYVAYTMVIAMIFFIAMLASKAGFISAAMAFVMAGWCVFKNTHSKLFAIIVVASCTFLLCAFIAISPGSKSRITATMNDLKVADTNTGASDNVAHSSTEIRMATWAASFHVLAQHPFGAGTGETEYALVKQYNDAGENYCAERRFNSHNQFLQAAAEHGFPGLLLLVVLCLFILVKAALDRNVLLAAMLLLCGLNFLFESFLEVQAGIVFFCFWLMILVHGHKEQTAQFSATLAT